MILADASLRASAMVLIGLAAHLLLRRHSAALRHAVLAVAMFAAAAVIPLSLVVPSLELTHRVPTATTQPLDTPVTAGIVVPSSNDPAPVAPGVALGRVALAVWAGGVLIGAVVLLAGLARLRVVASRATPPPDEWTRAIAAIVASRGLRRRVIIRRTASPDLLATFGLFRPRILLPDHARGWCQDRIRIVLLHEVAHIQRGDWVVQIGAALLRTVFWFNPLFWAGCAWLRRDSEHACDDIVLDAGVPPRDYAEHLLDLAQTCRPGPGWAAATLMARPSTLERRFAAMLNSRIDRRPVSPRRLAVAALLIAAAALPVAALHARQASPLPLSGAVYDTTGAVLPGVAVVVEDWEKKQWRAETNSGGRFEFPPLAPGHYSLQATLPGFRTLHHEFDLRGERDWDRAITLQVGDVRESINVRQSRTAAAAPNAGGGTVAPVRVGGNIRTPRKVLDVHPVYPQSMRDAGREGVVPLEATIGVDGAVHSVRVLSASIHPDFALAAVDAVRQWRFDPTLLNGKPVEVTMIVTVAFSLTE